MIEWTCIQCENEYTDEIDGDAEERMCDKCLDDSIGEKEFFEFIKRANRDLNSIQRFALMKITTRFLRRQ